MHRTSLFPLLLVACFEEGKSPASTTDTGDSTADPTAVEHECDVFTPTSQTGSFDVTITPDDLDGSMPFTAPSDARIGLLVVTHAADVNGFSVGLGVEGTNPDRYGVQGFGVFEATDGQDLGIRAAVSPGFTVVMSFGHFASLDINAEMPYTGTVDWTWVEGTDCYEPNDAPEDARRIPLNEDLEASMFGGMGPGGEAVDWYRIRVTERSRLTITFDGAPTIAPASGLSTPAAPLDFLWDGANDFAIVSGERGSLVWSWTVDPGEYLLLFEPFVGLPTADITEGGPERHLEQSYRFRVDAEPVE